MPLVAVDLLSFTGTKGGMETYTRELYRAVGPLADDLRFVGLASREGAALDHSWFPGEVIDTGISGENRFAWAYGELVSVARRAERIGADLIHSPATLGPRRSAMPTVVTMHDMLYWSHPEYMSTPLFTGPVKWMERRAAANAAHILTVSEVSKSEIVRYLGYPAERITVTPLAGEPLLDPSRRSPVADRALVLATGNRRPHKNWDSLIRALPLVDEAIRPRLVITGGRGEDPLAAVVAETGMQDSVTLKGWVSDAELAELVGSATVMAMPSFAEGSCLPALESMGAGLPVMLSDLPVLREVAGDAALYFDPRDLRSIAAAMTRVATEPSLVADLSRRGVGRAAEFSWAAVASTTLDVFRRALRG